MTKTIVAWYLVLYVNPMVAVPLPGIQNEAQCKDLAAHMVWGGKTASDYVCVDITKAKGGTSNEPKDKKSEQGRIPEQGAPIGPDGRMHSHSGVDM